jgi:hypothetical protein
MAEGTVSPAAFNAILLLKDVKYLRLKELTKLFSSLSS